VMSILRDIVVLSVLYGAIRYILSHHRIRKQLRMDFEELKKELKEDEGDPHTKGQRKAMHQEVLLHGMIDNVKKAKVVLVSNE
jgi:flagellar biosynthesis protein FlhB